MRTANDNEAAIRIHDNEYTPNQLPTFAPLRSLDSPLDCYVLTLAQAQSFFMIYVTTSTHM